MNAPVHALRPLAALVLSAILLWLTVPSGVNAGVTIITHGLNGNVDDWVDAMADAIPEYFGFFGSNFTTYRIDVTFSGDSFYLASTRESGSAAPTSESGEIIVKLDWRTLANDSFSTFEVASAVAYGMLLTNFISELSGHALVEFPLHLIGHSRGGSLVCELSRQLGTNGIWVDHLTTLDPHPLNNDGFFDFPYTVMDAPARTYESVLFHDNYWQDLNFLFYGEPVFGAFVRELTYLEGGYGGISASHSDVHLWYHGTVDWNTPTSDYTSASITSAERQNWWTAYELHGFNAGFLYS
jgi:pimeloyl-ACP methyl ester carboxylesterase